MMDPKVIADVSNNMNYANGNKASLPLINADVRNNPGIFPTPDAMAKLFVLKVQDPKLDRVRTRAWTKVKSGK
jgi:putrescine transport system substrate-binding protein